MMREKIIVWMFVCVILGLGFGSLLKTDEEYSLSERRRLQQFPEFTSDTIVSGTFMEDFEKYTQDQFVGRENFRTLKAVSEVYGLQKKDNNGIYLIDGYASAIEYPLNENSLNHAAEKIQDIYETYIKNSSCQAYFSIIPDKNYYLAGKNGYLSMDYPDLFERIQTQTENLEYIDITDLLQIEDYYRTDTHWKQESIVDVAENLAIRMGNKMRYPKYEAVTVTNQFRGVYAGQSALPLDAEPLTILNSELLEQCIVYDYQNDQETTVYHLESINGKDPYELFLSGPISLMTIENPTGQTGKELILFRDSFGSSIAPLLMEYYDKITLVDIRYLPANRLEQLIQFKDQDVLFLYSTLVLNHSETLK